MIIGQRIKTHIDYCSDMMMQKNLLAIHRGCALCTPLHLPAVPVIVANEMIVLAYCQYVTVVYLSDRVLSYCRDGDGPQHIKVVLEWEYSLYKRYGLMPFV